MVIFFINVQLSLTGHCHGLSDEEIKDLWVQANVDGNGVLDAMKHPSQDHSIFRAEIIDQIVDDYMVDFDSVLHGRKHPFLSDLHT